MKTFIVYLKDGRTIRIKAEKFATPESATASYKHMIQFYKEDGVNSDIYVRADGVAAIVPEDLSDSR